MIGVSMVLNLSRKKHFYRFQKKISFVVYVLMVSTALGRKGRLCFLELLLFLDILCIQSIYIYIHTYSLLTNYIYI